MLPEVQEIQHRRRRLGLTQTELARLAGVSQSLVAKLEGGLVDASYSKVKQIFEKLDEKEAEREEETAASVANRKIVSVRPSDRAGKAADLMRKNDFSQLPVKERDRYVGSIDSNQLVDASRGARVGDLMGPLFDVISSDTPLSTVRELLKPRHKKAVLVRDRGSGEIVGIVAPADLL
jgi:predicted transcriptional regulator